MAKIGSPIPALRGIHQRKFNDKNLLKTVTQSVYLTAVMAVILVLTLMILIFRPGPAIPDTTADFNTLTRVQFFAQNFTHAWLTGTERDVPAIKQMAADPDGIPGKWNTEPMEVSDLSVADITSVVDDPYTEWVVTVGATIVAPGTAAPQRAYYEVTVIQKGEALRAFTMPRPVNLTRPSLNIGSAYTKSIGLNSPIGTAVTNFTQAFYTQNAAGSLGRYVSANFDDEPLANSPYTSAEVIAITTNSEDDPAAAAGGDSVTVMVAAKLGMSLTTFSTVNIPMRLVAQDNGQWVVDALEEMTEIDPRSDGS